MGESIPPVPAQAAHTADGAPDATGRVAWRPALKVFWVGMAVWAGLLAFTFVLTLLKSPWYPGIPAWGGEWSGWLFPGWTIDRVWCFGTVEHCANFNSDPRFKFSVPGSLFYIGVWALICLLVGVIIASRRRRRLRG